MKITEETIEYLKLALSNLYSENGLNETVLSLSRIVDELIVLKIKEEKFS